MMLHCNVVVHNRLLPSATQTKSQCSVLTIGRLSDKGDVYIVLQTLQDKQETKYKICDNIVKIFINFVDNGKATIRLKDPSHDLIIESQTVQLKSFLRLLSHAFWNSGKKSFPIISDLNLENMSSTHNNKLLIEKISKYPVLEGFPKTLEELSIIGLDKQSFDRQILNLKYLKVLNLTNNKIESLPEEVGCLPHLQELILTRNYLGKSQFDWKWINQVEIKKNLCVLDITRNLITELPVQIGALNSLIKLKICQNMLKKLPQSIGRLRNLKYLELSGNSMSNLPGSMRNLKLDYLDVSCNPFIIFHHNNFHSQMNKPPSLFESAARAFLKTKITYDHLPRALVQYLDSVAVYCCVCTSSCFDRFIVGFLETELKRISCVVKSGHTDILLECYFCSNRCMENCINIIDI